YIQARTEAEAAIRASGIAATILRPWYVLGPGRRWPLVLVPLYKLFELFPPTRAGARRLGLVTIQQVVAALAQAVERPPQDVRFVEVPELRNF
ncbi:MAG: epimerase, partial [Gemmatimonadetes bacterium]|nr:epimerase [Gemmatimonadota bacterium]